MIISNELLRIQALPFDEDGHKLEPEEKPAERIVQMSAPVDGHLNAGTKLGELPVSVATQGKVHEFAQECRSLCANCKHFDLPRWQRYKAQQEATPAGKAALQRELLAYLSQVNQVDVDPTKTLEADPDVQAALNFLGICGPLTEIATVQVGRTEEIIVHPLGTCPAGFDGFAPRDTAADKRGSEDYDAIMRRAENG